MDNTKQAINTNLEYKDHTEFFHDFFKYKSKAHELLAFALNDSKQLIMAYQAIYLLLSYSSNYIDKKEELRKRLLNVKNMLKNPMDAIPELENILDEINVQHENSELLPKKKTEIKESQNIWRKQEDYIMQQITKGCADIIFQGRK